LKTISIKKNDSVTGKTYP